VNELGIWGYVGGTATIFYLTTLISLQSDRFVRRQSVQHSTLFRFALCRGPVVLVQCLTVNIRFYSPYLKKVIDILPSGSLADTRQFQQTDLRCSMFVSVLYITRAYGKWLEEYVRITQCFGQRVDSHFS